MEKPEREETLKEIGARVRARRNEQGLTQEQLAQAARVSKSFVSEIEAGQRGASGLKYLAIADALDVAVQWILRGKAEPALPESATRIPPEVAEVAETQGWTYKETADVAAQLHALVARRTRGGQAWKPSREYILRIAEALREADEK